MKWKDDRPNNQVKARFVVENLLRDYEDGLEYVVVEVMLGKRVGDDDKPEFLFKWANMEEPTQEPKENVDINLFKEFDAI